MIRIGVVNIDVSHPKMFASWLLRENRARYAAVYNDGFRKDDEVAAFVRDFALEKRCESVRELAEMVDIGFIQGCNWDRHLSYVEAFFQAKKPVFIDKPIVGNIRDCERLEAYAKEGNVILGSSSLRYSNEIASFLKRPTSERGEILHVYGTCGVDEFNYGIHIVESICGLIQSKALQTQFVARSEKGSMTCENFAVTFVNGATASYSLFSGLWMPCVVVIMTTKGTYSFEIDSSTVYKALLDRICDYMETGKNSCATVEELTDSIRIMLAGRLSRESNGTPIRTDQIPKDDKGFDGGLFEKGYAAAAKRIYVD
ncbi:MAG TPA: Gfo/Idh/MocA family oxidoreductase [Spirochaetia bacterium]|nr:Gfo/Idh/MocA family oxidoreductase [Spirochaetia bacterium]